MAEFCKECFKRKILVPSDNITDDMLMMSAAYDICEGCGEYKPMVVGVEEASAFQKIKDELIEAVRPYNSVMQPTNMEAIVKAICDICDELNNIRGDVNWKRY